MGKGTDGESGSYKKLVGKWENYSASRHWQVGELIFQVRELEKQVQELEKQVQDLWNLIRRVDGRMDGWAEIVEQYVKEYKHVIWLCSQWTRCFVYMCAHIYAKNILKKYSRVHRGYQNNWNSVG